ncbi:LOW QUALITY PROTEIN: calreticulin-3 [Porphyrio hochstetteri]
MNAEYKAGFGKFKLATVKFYGDPVDKGLQTSASSKFYAFSSQFKPFSHKGKALDTVKHEQKICCGGGYIKIFSSDLEQKKSSGDTHCYIMFGLGICGSETRVSFILNYKNKLYPIGNQSDVSCRAAANALWLPMALLPLLVERFWLWG